MNANPDFGFLLLIGCFTAPLLIGMLIGYNLRGRVDRLGIPWALLPFGTHWKHIWESAA